MTFGEQREHTSISGVPDLTIHLGLFKWKFLRASVLIFVVFPSYTPIIMDQTMFS